MAVVDQSSDPLPEMNAKHRRVAPFDDLEAFLGDQHVALGGRRYSSGFDRAAGWREQARERVAGGGQIEEIAWLQLELVCECRAPISSDPDELDGRQAPFAHADRQRSRLIDRRRRAGRRIAFALVDCFDVTDQLLRRLRKRTIECQVETADEVGLCKDRRPLDGDGVQNLRRWWRILSEPAAFTAKHQHEGQDHTRGAGGHYV